MQVTLVESLILTKLVTPPRLGFPRQGLITEVEKLDQSLQVMHSARLPQVDSRGMELHLQRTTTTSQLKGRERD
jgi:hypothetical protein